MQNINRQAKETSVDISGDMVRSIQNGHKTQLVSLLGLKDVNSYPGSLSGDSYLGPLGYRGFLPSAYYLTPKARRLFGEHPLWFHWFFGEQSDLNEMNPIPVLCPFGQIGDMLWVRETWRVQPTGEDGHNEIEYKADFDKEELACYGQRGGYAPRKWRPPLHMPRYASRLTVEITGLKAGILQNMSEVDAQREGWLFQNMELSETYDPVSMDSARRWFSTLWDSHFAKRGYPWNGRSWWVWFVDFKKLEM